MVSAQAKAIFFRGQERCPLSVDTHNIVTKKDIPYSSLGRHGQKQGMPYTDG